MLWPSVCSAVRMSRRSRAIVVALPLTYRRKLRLRLWATRGDCGVTSQPVPPALYRMATMADPCLPPLRLAAFSTKPLPLPSTCAPSTAHVFAPTLNYRRLPKTPVSVQLCRDSAFWLMCAVGCGLNAVLTFSESRCTTVDGSDGVTMGFSNGTSTCLAVATARGGVRCCAGESQFSECFQVSSV